MWEKIKQFLTLGKNKKRHDVINKFQAEISRMEVKAYKTKVKSKKNAEIALQIAKKHVVDRDIIRDLSIAIQQ